MQPSRVAVGLAFLSIGAFVPGFAAAQGPASDGAFFLEWQGASNGTLALDANGLGNATFRVGFQPPSHSGSCIGGSMMSIPLDARPVPRLAHVRIEPPAVSLPGDHVPNAATPATRWSEPVSFSTTWYVNETPPGTVHTFVISTGMGKITGGSCTPAVPSTPTGGRLYLNTSLGAASPKTSTSSSPHQASSVGWPAALLAAVGALGLRRRNP